MENRLLNRKEAIEELHRGRELGNQLLEVVHKWNGDEGSTSSAEDLVQKILRSLTNTLLFFRDSSRPNSEDMEETCNGTLTLKNRRGCYKRRRTLQTWEKDTPSLIDDGHTWRKYGQKLTLNAKYLRSYYRCTHKYDQGCQAIKQVQRIQENPPLYRTAYYGHHTCKNLLNPEMILEPASPSYSSILLSFNQA